MDNVIVKQINKNTVLLKEVVNKISVKAVGGGTQGQPGQSAYEIWLSLGNTGTEQDFINSLNSDKGITQYHAGEVLGGHRFVYLDENRKLKYADIGNIESIKKIIGITVNSGNVDDLINVRNFGEVVEPSFNLDVTKSIYLSNNGLYTQIYNENNVCLILGKAISVTSMFIDIQQPILTV